MAVEIVMPRVDMDMTSGRMGRWHAAEGAHVVKGATLFEIETDKAAMEVDAPASGVLKFVAASEGDVLPVGACIGWIVAEGENFVPPASDRRAAGAPPTPRLSSACDRRPKRDDAAYADAALGAARDARRAPDRARARLSAREREGLRTAGAHPAARRRGAPPQSARCRAAERCQSAMAAARRGRADRVPARALAPISMAGGPFIGFCRRRGRRWRSICRATASRRLGEEASFEALVDAARSVADRGGRSAAHLVGHSLGGAVAAALSQAPGVKALSLMLIAPAGLGEETNPPSSTDSCRPTPRRP